MKTTIEIPDQLLRRAKATAALRGESLKQLFSVALRAHLEALSGPSEELGWKRAFGRAHRADVDEVDAVVRAELETVDRAEWR